MQHYQIAVVVGSLRKGSLNQQLATTMTHLAPSYFSFKQLQIGELPLYNQDDDANQTESVLHLRNVLAYLDVPTMGQPEGFIHAKDGLFDAQGNIGPGSKEFLQGWIDSFAAWVITKSVSSSRDSFTMRGNSLPPYGYVQPRDLPCSTYKLASTRSILCIATGPTRRRAFSNRVGVRARFDALDRLPTM